MEKPENCLNCETALNNDYGFCFKCGQPTNTHPRLTLNHIGHEVFHVLTHADKGALYLTKALATRPGASIREYLSGRHKKYFNPFNFFFIVLGIYVLSNSIFKPFNAVSMVNEQNTTVVKYPAEIKTQTQKLKYDKIMERQAVAMNFMNTKTNIVLCISTPFIAFIMFLQYRRRINYAEQLVIMTFVNSFLNLLSIFIFTPLLFFTAGTSAYQMVVVAMLLSHVIYMTIVYHGVLQMPPGFKGYLKSLGSTLLGIGGWVILSFILVGGYMMYGLI